MEVFLVLLNSLQMADVLRTIVQQLELRVLMVAVGYYIRNQTDKAFNVVDLFTKGTL